MIKGSAAQSWKPFYNTVALTESHAAAQIPNLLRTAAAGGLPPLYVAYAPAAVRSGELAESRLDEALRHALGMRFDLGLFDPIAYQPYWQVLI